jgi:hypothetical protein
LKTLVKCRSSRRNMGVLRSMLAIVWFLLEAVEFVVAVPRFHLNLF